MRANVLYVALTPTVIWGNSSMPRAMGELALADASPLPARGPQTKDEQFLALHWATLIEGAEMAWDDDPQKRNKCVQNSIRQGVPHSKARGRGVLQEPRQRGGEGGKGGQEEEYEAQAGGEQERGGAR